MPRKRFLGASAALHVGLFALVAFLADLHIHGRPMAPASPPLAPVKIVDLPSPSPERPPPFRSAIAYPHATLATPRPTPPPAPTPRPRRHLAARPRPTLKPKELEAYKKKLPELARKKPSEADKIAERLKKLGLDPSAAASMDAAVKIAINAGGDKLYHPTTPLASPSATGSAPASGSASPFALPQAWASPSTPLQAFLDRVLPPDRGYDYDLTYDSAGRPELRIRYRHGNLVDGSDLVFVERWDPSVAASPSVDVQVLSASGKPIGHFTFTMLKPPGGSLDTFVQAMAGSAMIQWVQGAGH